MDVSVDLSVDLSVDSSVGWWVYSKADSWEASLV